MRVYWKDADPPPEELKKIFCQLQIERQEELMGPSLIWEEGHLSLKGSDKQLKPIFFDWVENWRQIHKKWDGPFARALGGKKIQGAQIVDATCGAAKDSLFMLALGCRVQAFESAPMIYALLWDARRRAERNPALCQLLQSHFQLIFADAKAAELAIPPSIVYLDPMYQLQRRKAKQGKEMLLIGEVATSDEDLQQLFLWGIKQAKERLVIKRAIHAPLVYPNPKASFYGKSTRYDIYMSQELGPQLTP